MSITGLKNRDDTQTLNMSEEKKKIDSVLENKNNPEMSEEQENIIKITLRSSEKTLLIAIYNNQNQRRYIGVKLD